MNFDFHAKYVYLTYPQFPNFSKFRLLIELCDKVPAVISNFIICKEQHKDEGDHYHALLEFDRKYRSRSSTVFDIQGHHPNIQSPRDIYRVADYIRKDGDSICSEETFAIKASSSKTDKSELWKSAIATASNTQSCLDAIGEVSPRGLCKAFNSIKAFAEWKFKEITEDYTSPFTDFIIGEDIQSWLGK